MTLTRRTFLTSATAALAGAVVGVAADAQPADAAALPLRRSTFSPFLGRLMTASLGGRHSRIRLRRIRDVVGARPHSDASFVLEFTARHHLPDGLYTLTHPGAGRHVVFMSAVNARPRRRYDVVVNRAVPPEYR